MEQDPDESIHEAHASRLYSYVNCELINSYIGV